MLVCGEVITKGEKSFSPHVALSTDHGIRILSGHEDSWSRIKYNCGCGHAAEKNGICRWPGDVVAHVKAPFRVRGKMNNFEINSDRFADVFQDLQQRNTRAGRNIERPAGHAPSQMFDDLAKIRSKNVIPDQLAIAVNVHLPRFPDARD